MNKSEKNNKPNECNDSVSGLAKLLIKPQIVIAFLTAIAGTWTEIKGVGVN